MSRITANDRVRRMLSIVPWIAARADGVPIVEVCARFDIDRKTLLADLTTLSFVGVAPFTPDTQVDAVIEEGKVFIHLPQWFDRPLRLTPEQGLALVAAGQSLLSVHGADPDGPLARGIAKVAGTLGVDPEHSIDVRLGDAAAATVGQLQEAIQRRRRVEIDYYTYGRDEQTTRVIDPHRLYADQGQWYLAGYCHLAEGDRIFRVDRISRIVELGDAVAEPTEGASLAVFRPSADDPRVVLDLRPEAAWVIEQYPIEHLETLADGTHRVTLAITARPWLERLLLRLGPEATVVSADADLASCGRDAAARVLARYQRA
jgi:proteasome accessory factor C